VGFVHRVVGAGENDTVSFDVMASWYADTDDPGRFAQLRALVEREPRQDSDSIAGRARQTGRVVWVPNVSVDPAIDPDRRAVMTGIRGACAVPVTHGGQVVAVLEFLSSDQLTPDATTTRLLEAIAEMLAWVLTSRTAA
jgi:GAF domain-containing protein